MQKSRFLIPLMLVVLLLSSCYHKMTPSRFRIVDSLTTSRPDTLARLDSVQLDSLYFVYTHHYHVGFNFVTRGKHLFLTRQQPEEIVTGLPVDSFAVDKGKHLVVADVRILSTDPVDSVWVQVATEDSRFGCGSLQDNKRLHDRLEKIYLSAMDFSMMDVVLEDVAGQIVERRAARESTLL